MTLRRLQLERLEDRSMLAVTTSMNFSTGVLSVNSNSAGDTVALEGIGQLGAVAIYANGASLNSFGNVRSIKVNMGSGNDRLDVAALVISGDLTINMGSGSDVFNLNNTPDGPGLGDNNVFIGGSINANLGSNPGDRVDWDGDNLDYSIFIGQNVVLKGVADVDLDGNGGLIALEESDILIGGSLTISLTEFGDQNGDGQSIDMDDVNVGNTTTINGSSAADRVRITDSKFSWRFTISLGGGNDVLDLANGIDNHNTFGYQFVYSGGAGTDRFESQGTNYGATPVFVSVEIQI